MSFDAWLSVITVLMVVGGLLTNRVSAELAMVVGLVFLVVVDVLPASEAFAGVSHPSVIMIATLFVVARGLKETGAIQQTAERMLGHPTNVWTAQLRLMAPVIVLSGFVNNTPVVATLLSIVDRWAREIRVSASKLFIPLSFAAILGGRLTLIGSSSNIVLMSLYLEYVKQQSGHAAEQLLSPFSQFWGIAAIGLPMAGVGMAFVLLFSRWLLPDRKPVFRVASAARRYTVVMEVRPESPIVGKSIEEAGLRHLPGLFLIEIDRPGEQLPAPSPFTKIRTGDHLRFAGILSSVIDLRRIKGLVPATDQVAKIAGGLGQRVLVEAVVSHNSRLLGVSVRESKFRTVYNAAIIAVHRNGEVIKAKVGDIVLKPGDTLLLETDQGFVDAHQNSADFYLVSGVPHSTPVRHDRSWVALVLFSLLVVSLGFLNLEPLKATVTCAVLMVITGCVTRSQAIRSIDWHVLITVAAALGIGNALQVSGATAYVASGMSEGFNALGGNPTGMLFVTFCLASLLAQVLTNNGAAVVMFPLAMATASAFGLSTTPFLFVLMAGVGAAFATPISYPTNLMVQGPGGYRFTDFALLGVPLTLLLALVATVVSPIVFPFTP